jgi:DNA polymerase elongation subunit (family B)
MANVSNRPKKQLIVTKSFRLLDFHTFDESPEKLSDSDNDSNGGKKYKKDNLQFIIQMFGVNEEGETCSIFIQDFQPFFYVKVGDSWTQGIVNQLSQHILSKIDKKFNESILNVELVQYKKLYGFTGGKKDKFVKFTFKNTTVMNRVKNLWYTYVEDLNDPNNGKKRVKNPFLFQGIELDLYETTIPPLLRYFHIHNISPSGWISVQTNKSQKPSVKTTTCKYEYICSIRNIKPLPDKETPVPYKICSFDIEASSSHGDFPLPIKTYKRLATNIVDIFIKQSECTDKVRCKDMLQRIILTAFGYSRFDDVDIVYPKKMPSKELLLKLIQIFSDETIDKAKKANKEEDNSSLLTIDSVFEQMKELQGQGGSGEEDENENIEETVVYGGGKKPRKIKIDRNNGIIDVLISSNYDRDEKIQITNEVMTRLFPRLEGDKITFIGSTFMKYGEQETYMNHCVVLGSCDPVEGAVIESVDNEIDLLLKWTELIQRENPDIIIGYNIFGFDYEFMFRRAQENHCENEFLMLSRKVGDLCAKFNADKEMVIENTKLAIASGEYDLRFFKMIGRLQIDMYAYFRRDFNLSSYKLDDVAGQFISDDVKKFNHAYDINHGDITELFTQNITGLHVGDFIHIELIGFTADYYMDGKKFKVLGIEKDREVTENYKGKEVTNKYNIIYIEGHQEFDKTKSIKWGTAKDDVTPQDIFRLSNGSSSDRAIVAKYCIQDCNLVHHLMNKIDVITGYVEMARICSVPVTYLVFRGQGIKLTSFVAKICREENTLMPDLEKTDGGDGYEGAIVLPPKCAMYMDNPVACVDYSSLYPSSMISQNLSHDSKVWTKEYDLRDNLVRETGEKAPDGTFVYDNIPGYEYIDLEFDTFRYIRKTPTSRAEKTKSGKMICRWAQFPDNKKGILPSILEYLLKARKDTRNLIKTEKDPFMQNILDKRQLAYKVTANSLYGQCGSRTSTFYDKDIAASTTATGRMMITYARRIIEEVYGDRVYELESGESIKTKAEYIYGDSVANYTPVYVKIADKIDICTIENLAEKYGGNSWVTCIEEGKQEKEFCELTDVETWTEKGWTRLYRIIRHKLAPHKKMIRILTHTGLVDVTDDHSLIQKNGEEISPKNVIIGTELLHNKLPVMDMSNESMITIEQAKVMGFFFGDGSCGNYDCASGKKSSWALNNAFPNILEKYLELCKIAYPEFEWRIMDTMETSGVCKISPKSNKYGSIVEFVKNYRKLMYFEKAKIIPSEIMNSSIEIRQAFWDGLYDADGDKDANGYVRIDQKNQISANHIAWLASSLGWKTSINTRKDKPDVYRITMTKKTQRKNPNAIKKMHEIPYNGYVYDLTTENHHFAAGIGNMIVHNTDSVFFTFNLENPVTGEKIRGKPALEMTIEIAQDAAKLCTQWLKPPMELSYEKTLMPFVLLSKKRYVGMLYEEDPNKGKLKYMGLSLKRRDSCDYLKDVYGGILNILMKEYNLSRAIEFLNTSLNNLVDGVVPMDKLTITKALRSDYKNPLQIGHKVLADRIGKRDPGNKPKPGDRMRFVFIVNNQPKALMGDKIETPEFIIENKIKIDYSHYITNQLMKPLQQLFGLALTEIWTIKGKSQAIRAYNKDLIELQKDYPDLEEYMKKKEKYCSTKVKALLFDNVLNKIYNEKHNIQTITNFFVKK